MFNAPVYIKEIGIENYACFRGNYQFSFVDENERYCQWTVFLGNNNTGKTNLLKVIATFNSSLSLVLYPEKTKFGLHSSLKALVIQNEDTNTNLILQPVLSQDFSFTQLSEPWQLFGNNALCYAYGVNRTIKRKGIGTEEKEFSNVDNLLFSFDLINFEDWLFQLDYAANNIVAEVENRKKAADKRNLLIDVLKSEIFPEINDIRFVSNEKAENHIEYYTKDGWRRLFELGYGYQAMLAWLMDFCKKMFDRYPNSKNPLKEPAVLLVDEIDLHLHPYWQRTIIKFLSDLLPKTQFIVTTHSPFILQSMENVNLYTLRREGDHTISTPLGNQSFIGWGIEEILSEIMELGNDIKTNSYQELSQKFDKALADENYKDAKQTYDELVKILHPANSKIKIMEIQLSQIAHD